MSLSPDTLTSKRVDVTGTLNDAIELCYQKGWTDGLPVIPPTQDRVLEFLDFVDAIHPTSSE